MVWGGGFLSGLNPDGLSAMLFGVTDGVAKVFPQDYAGGTVVHINAGMAGLVLALVIGKRLGFGKEAIRPHNLPLTMIGAGLLWFGWFGFNVGLDRLRRRRRRREGHRAVHVRDRRHVDQHHAGHLRGDARLARWWSGSATARPPRWAPRPVWSPAWSPSRPSCGAVDVYGAIIIGAVAGAAVRLRRRPEVPLRVRRLARRRRRAPRRRHRRHRAHRPPVDGLRPGRHRRPVLRRRRQAAGHPGPDGPVAIIWSGVVTLVIALAIKYTIGWRITEDDGGRGHRLRRAR